MIAELRDREVEDDKIQEEVRPGLLDSEDDNPGVGEGGSSACQTMEEDLEQARSTGREEDAYDPSEWHVITSKIYLPNRLYASLEEYIQFQDALKRAAARRL